MKFVQKIIFSLRINVSTQINIFIQCKIILQEIESFTLEAKLIYPKGDLQAKYRWLSSATIFMGEI